MRGMLKVSHAIDVELVHLPEELTDEAVLLLKPRVE